ncbi:MAG TPA: 50S ribosomal protein L35 [Candidatus Saccharimonadales bacterium]|nr:50S ribosomal protein L35 [Candidatus Saccharimonadales bacterium]
MPKLKTHSGTKDRVKITKNGKVLLRHPMTSHFLEKKSESRKRRLAGVISASGANKKNIKLRLGAK